MARQVLGMASQPPPVDEMTVRLMIRLGCAAASFMAAMPPMLCPTRCTRSQRRCVYGGEGSVFGRSTEDTRRRVQTR